MGGTQHTSNCVASEVRAALVEAHETERSILLNVAIKLLIVQFVSRNATQSRGSLYKR